MDIADYNKTIIEEFRANGGKVGGPFEGASLLLLHTVGAKSGAARVNPLAYLVDADRVVIIASFAGADTNPPWYHNLVAKSDVEVEVGSERYAATAEVVSEPERTRLYNQMAERMPAFAEYQAKTSRAIPVVVLNRKA
ncbi:MAG: nitroreductase family deazaflavin-dependent oxidoreductase [Proteobacteria bacterium]|nr:nitroreductase family deazaflavin-dependent oxidoreductase [Pseudomonadota bacterium]